MSTAPNVTGQSEELVALLDEVYSRETVVGKSGETRDLFPTALRRADGERLYQAVLREGATRTVETGFAYGLSGLFICKALLENGADRAVHVAADPFQKKNYDDIGLWHFEQAGLSSILEFHRRESGFVLPELVEAGRTFDLGFVDGGHRFEVAFQDVYYMTRLVEPGGLIIVDDMWMPAVRLAVDFCVENLGVVHENRRPPRHVVRRRIRSVLHPHRRVQRTDQETVAYLRTPEKPVSRSWEEVRPFGFRY